MTDANKKIPPVIQRPLKNCIFCRLDITTLLHAQCLESCCRGFIQCLNCFSLGLEFDTHLPTHRYKLISTTNIPVFTDDWGADEELALLEAVGKCGLGNWTDIAAYVGTKSEHTCETHYFNQYIFSPYSPLPDLTAPYPLSAKRELENSKEGFLDVKKITFASEPNDSQSLYGAAHPSSTSGGPGVAAANAKKQGKKGNVAGNSASSFEYELWYRCRLKQAHFEKPQETSRWKLQQMEFKGQLKNNLAQALGYLPQRHDYEVEYLNDAEKDISEIEFRQDDTTIERELKLRVLELYNHVLDERIERKEFIDRYQLLLKRERKLTREEQQVYKSLRPFARYLEAEDFDELVRSVVVERSLRLRIEQLQTYRLNGIQTLQDGLQFDLDYQAIVSEWESIHRKKWLDASTIPVGQYEALQNVLNDLDKELDGNSGTNEESSGGGSGSGSGSGSGGGDNNEHKFPTNNKQNISNIDQNENDSGLYLDSEGRPVVKFVNGYPTLPNLVTGYGKNIFDNVGNENNKQNNPSPFSSNILPKDDVPSFFTPNQNIATTNSTLPMVFTANSSNTSQTIIDQNNTLQNKQGGVYEKSIPITQAQSDATNCPCVGAGGVGTCLYNIKDYPHAAMLSQAEQLLCKELHILPQHYLVIKDQLIKEAVQNGYITKGTARNVLKVDVHVTDRVLNFCISQHIVPGIYPNSME
jgi:transcriptional adapter 2-alpha